MKKKFTLSALIILLFSAIGFSQSTYTYTGKPMFKIATTQAGNPLGSYTVELFPNIAPKATRNFDSLVSTSFYDGTAFHRVVPGFVIQGGDPNSVSGPVSTWGNGNPSQPTVPAEFSSAKHVRGSLSAARSTNINSATSQFFICVASNPTVTGLNGQYSLYGRVLAGMNVVDAIVNTPTVAGTQRPVQKIEMFVTYIGSDDTIPNAPVLNYPADNADGFDTIPAVLLKWNAVSDGIIYHLDVATDAAYTNTVVSANTSDLSYLVSTGSGGDTYYWRVRVNNGGNFSPYSQTRKYYSYITTGVKTHTGNNPAVQVFPNPSGGRFTFSGSKKGGKLEVFDTGGKLIYSAAIKDSNFTLDLEGKDKGIYTYRISESGAELQRGKLILK